MAGKGGEARGVARCHSCLKKKKKKAEREREKHEILLLNLVLIRTIWVTARYIKTYSGTNHHKLRY